MVQEEVTVSRCGHTHAWVALRCSWGWRQKVQAGLSRERQGRGFLGACLPVPNSLRQLGIAGAATGASGREGPLVQGEAEGPLAQRLEVAAATDQLRVNGSCTNRRPFSVGACLCQPEERDKPSENIVQQLRWLQMAWVTSPKDR